MVKEMMFSKTAITVDSAAKDRNRKNAPPHSRPRAMWLKILGRVTKTSAGPSPVETPKAEQAGKIINPAVKATQVSSTPMRRASPASLCSFPI